MKTLIISLNSKFIHSALAAWYLKAACDSGCGEVVVSEHTVNENMDAVLSSIYSERPDIAAFSCYIWNISHVCRLASSLKKLLPDTLIILGGPEVSFDAADILNRHSFVDLIISGEGDKAFPEVIRMLNSDYDGNAFSSEAFAKEAAGIDGLAFRKNGAIVVNEPALIEEPDSLPSPYTDEMIASLKNKIAYFEASRGCPFSCSYCLSSASTGTRHFTLERVFSDLDRLVGAGVRQIKFVDRTFNANVSRAKSIIRHILELNEGLSSGNDPVCNFHFEVGADLFDDEIIELLTGAPKGLFQLEAGVQSTNMQALSAVCRRTDIGRLSANLRKIRENGNVHIHADLIAGLPFENYESFGKSFDDVYRLKPHHLQLGFLKLLKGTRLRERASEYGYLYRDYPPYEILAGRHISGDELIKLKGIAELTEKYYNSGRFTYTLDYMIAGFFASPFEFFERLYEYYKVKGYLDISLPARDLYLILYEFFQTISCSDGDSDTIGASVKDAGCVLTKNGGLIFCELLRLDFLASDNSGTLPDFMEKLCPSGFNNGKNPSGNGDSRYPSCSQNGGNLSGYGNNRYSADFREKCIRFLGDTDRINRMIPETTGMTPKQILKKVHFERFFLQGDVSQILFTGDVSSKRDVSLKGDSSSKGDGSQKRDSSSITDSGCITLLFNYFFRDKVTGRYQFYVIDL